MKCGVLLNQFLSIAEEEEKSVQVEHPDLTFVNIFSIKGNTAVLLITSKNFNIGMHADMYEPVWFKFGPVMDTAELYNLTLL